MASSQPIHGVAVGRYALKVGEPAGTLISPGPQIADDTPVEIPVELAEELGKDERQTVGERFARATLAWEEATSRLEDAEKLLRAALDGSLDLDAVLAHAGDMLDVLDSLDRDDRWEEWLRYARTVNSLIALAKRWATLVRSLETVLSAAERAPELEAAVAWAQHELGTLRLAVEDAVGAQKRLETARSIRRRLGDGEGLAATEQSLSILCRQRSGQSRTSRRVLAAVTALLLLLVGGVAGAFVDPIDDADEGGSGAGTMSDPVTVTVQTAGDGEGRVTSPSGIDCPGRCETSVERGSRIRLRAVAAGDAVFTGWSSGCEGPGRCAPTVVAPISITARFGAVAPGEPTLTVIKRGGGGGTVTSTRAGISCGGTCIAPFAQGELVVLTQVADDGSDFAGWRGAGCSGTADCPVTLDGPQEVISTFDLEPSDDVTLTTSVVDEGGSITTTSGSDPAGRDCTPGCPYPRGTGVTLTAVPGKGANSLTWTGCEPAAGDPGRCEVTMSADREVSVDFFELR